MHVWQRSLVAGALALTVLAAATPAAADAADAGAPDLPPPGPSWLWSDGAIPFIYAPALTAIVFRALVEPPDEPRLFDPDEGGAVFDGDTVPEEAVAGYVVVGALATAFLPSDDSNYHHAKGFLSATMTTLGVTEVTKNLVGRHRPHFQDPSDLDQRRSFFSGHASMTFATSTYLGLYLHGHVFARLRGPDRAFAWWETAPLAALAAGTVAVAWTRLDDNRHHLSDVAVGAGVGSAAAVGFYAWNERRYRADKRGQREGLRGVRLAPTPAGTGLLVQGRF